MKRIVISLILGAWLLCGADFNGLWEGPTSMKTGDGRTMMLHVKIKQESDKLSGGVWTEDHDAGDPRPIRNATIDRNRLRFEVPQHGDLVVTFDLVAEEDTLSGVAKFQGENGPQELKLSLKRVPAR